ncbi:Uncharacterized protein OBRU01_20272 [Operophtera brumata]|uniref:Uncharacterized protein n=1 Tax=Operophtera brumata TaxID=104452 RepID=A0A0L7KVF7_OPEBR|nr:Uncharacterized protein OBRU01_20272 [Operophtera brumata]
MRYFFGKNSTKKTPEELERADERKRRLQRERSRRYRALKNARRQHEGGVKEEARIKPPAPSPDELSDDGDEPPTLCHLMHDASSDGASDDNSAHSAAELKAAPRARDLSLTLAQLLSAPNTELDYPTVHSLMFHWLQT